MYVGSFLCVRVTRRMLLEEASQGASISAIIANPPFLLSFDHNCYSGLTSGAYLVYWNGRALIFVVSLAPSDRGRIDVARQELHWMTRERGASHSPLLVFANKSDLNTAQAIAELDAQSPSKVQPWTKEELWEALEMDKVKERAKTIIVCR